MVKRSLKPRNQPQQARSQRTRGDILEATARLLNKYDEGSVSTNLIAKTTGISIGTLYKHYPNKDAILSDLIDLYIAEDIQSIQKALVEKSENLNSKEIAEQVLEWILQTHKEQHRLRATLYSNLGRLLKNQKAFEARNEIGKRLTRSALGKVLTDPKRMLMVVAAINAMIHVLSQLPTNEEDWQTLRSTSLQMLTTI
ncbi:MAG TPA: TetR/AcrR family transcriptional regulator [Bdellovibrio sp.]|uniref:TetR/AcrR family transcriptional regulator n=1 Tax=Bdellovibrio sp. TaxID=28201 RepID=UPI002EDE3C6E